MSTLPYGLEWRGRDLSTIKSVKLMDSCTSFRWRDQYLLADRWSLAQPKKEEGLNSRIRE